MHKYVELHRYIMKKRHDSCLKVKVIDATLLIFIPLLMPLTTPLTHTQPQKKLVCTCEQLKYQKFNQ